MPRKWTRVAVLATAGMIVATASARAGDPTASMKQGNPQLKSAGPLGFGPEGILFVGDTQGSAVFAIDTADRAPRPGSRRFRSTTWPRRRPRCSEPSRSRS